MATRLLLAWLLVADEVLFSWDLGGCWQPVKLTEALFVDNIRCCRCGPISRQQMVLLQDLTPPISGCKLDKLFQGLFTVRVRKKNYSRAQLSCIEQHVVGDASKRH
jgi:hypothetical protein